MAGSPPKSDLVVLYDGVCGLCNWSVQFVLKHDRREVFRFAALQSNFAGQILRRHGLAPETLDTLYLVRNHGRFDEQLFSRSDAVIEILRGLGGLWSVLGAVGGAIPRTARNFLYDRVARNRYRIFGKRQSCAIPTPEQRARFLDQ